MLINKGVPFIVSPNWELGSIQITYPWVTCRVGWCSGTPSGPFSQVESRQLGHMPHSRQEKAGSNPVRPVNHIHSRWCCSHSLTKAYSDNNGGFPAFPCGGYSRKRLHVARRYSRGGICNWSLSMSVTKFKMSHSVKKHTFRNHSCHSFKLHTQKWLKKNEDPVLNFG